MASAASDPNFTMPASRKLLAGLVLASGNFMVVLDITIANVSIPHIAGDLGISMDQGAWIITSYAVAEAICVPLSGWLAQRFGAVRLFMFSMFGFGLFSLLCGLSTTLGMLVACRIAQGIFGAPLMPMSQTLLMRIFPPAERPTAMAIWASTIMLAPGLGPILGGYLSDVLSWHWIFLINVPITIACTLAAFALLRPVETESRKVPIDRMGLALLVFWIACMQVVLDIGRDHDWFDDPLIVVMTVLAVVGFLAFIIWELTEEHPVVNLSVFGNRGFSAGVFALALAYGAFIAGNVVVPQWLQSSMGYNATLAGVVNAASALTSILTTQLVVRMSRRFDARLLVSCGLIWVAVSMLLRTLWTTQGDIWTFALAQGVVGMGMAFFAVPLTSITLSVVKPHEVADAAGLQNFVRTISVAVCTSLALTIWGNGTRVAQSEIVSQLQPDSTMRTLGDAGVPAEQGRLIVADLVTQQATMLSLNNTFMISAILCILAAAVIWISPKAMVTAKLDDAH